MKKVVAMMLAATLMLGSLAACSDRGDSSSGESSSSGSSSQENGNGPVDGEYKASYNTMALDRTIDYLTVKVTDGNYEIVEYTCKEVEGTEGGEEAASGDASSGAASSEAASSGEASSGSSSKATEAESKARKAMTEILASYEAAGGDVDQMHPVDDTAQEHFYRFIRMMREIHAAAEEGKTGEIKLDKYADGTYKVTAAEPDITGWTPYVEMTVSGGKITSLVYDAAKDGKKITEDADANAEANKPSDYYPAIAKSFTDGGEDLTKLFAPSGGGLATKSFTKLMTPTMASAMSGGAKEFTAPKYVDGTYRAEFADFDEFGWKPYVVVQVFNDKVTVKEFDSMNKEVTEGYSRSIDSDLNKKMKEATGTYDFNEAAKELANRFAAAGGDPLAVENVAGATVSTNDFKLLVGEILATTAVEGDTGVTLQVERVASEKAA